MYLNTQKRTSLKDQRYGYLFTKVSQHNLPAAGPPFTVTNDLHNQKKYEDDGRSLTTNTSWRAIRHANAFTHHVIIWSKLLYAQPKLPSVRINLRDFQQKTTKTIIELSYQVLFLHSQTLVVKKDATYENRIMLWAVKSSHSDIHTPIPCCAEPDMPKLE